MSQINKLFRWLFLNGVNKTEINGIKSEVWFDTALPEIGWAKGIPLLSPTLQGPGQVHSVYLSVLFICLFIFMYLYI